MIEADPSTQYRLDQIAPAGERAKDVGLARQLMGADLITRGDGWERGVRSVLLQNDRVALEVVVDRGFDIAGARVRQVPIGWRSATDIVAPWFVENTGFGPHRSFFGGLLKTCGLDHIGLPAKHEVSGGRQAAGEFPMHGRISGAPGRLHGYGVAATADGGLEAFVEGSVTQVAVFDEHLTLHRRISIAFGNATIRMADTVTNHGYRPAQLAMLYHVNVGWPVLSPQATLCMPRGLVNGAHDYAPIAPVEDGASRSWTFEADGGSEGRARAGIANANIDASQSAGLLVSWDPAVLPTMLHWQMNRRAGNYVLAFEPSTIQPAGSGSPFPILEPAQSMSLGIDIELLHGAAGQDLLETAEGNAPR